MKEHHSARLFFTLGVLCLAVVMIIWAFMTQVLSSNFPSISSSTLSNTSDLPYDPLVTVTPKEFLGGTPKKLTNDPVKGAANATVTIIEFGDFQCEGCRTMKTVFEQVLQEYPNTVELVWKDFPLPSVHPQSEDAAHAARCAQEQEAFWEYHNILFDRQGELALLPWSTMATDLGLEVVAFDECMKQESTKDKVVEGYFIARSLDLASTPSFYINDTLIDGTRTIEEMRVLINSELQVNEE